MLKADPYFADSLFQEGDYLNAAHEYKRFLFLHPDTPRIDFIAFRVAASYQNAGKLENAIRAYQLLIDTYPKSILLERAENNIAQCHVLSGDSAQGLSSLKRFLSEHKGSSLAPRVQFTIGMLHVDKGEWEQASRAWSDVYSTYPESSFAKVSDRLARTLKNADTLPHRCSPTVAGVLSALIPGSGQVYSGRTVDGLYTFVGMVVLGGASLYYADQERYEVAGTCWDTWRIFLWKWYLSQYSIGADFQPPTRDTISESTPTGNSEFRLIRSTITFERQDGIRRMEA